MASCWALLKRWISSMNRTVRRPARRGTLASATTLRRSATRAVTADIATMRALVSLARSPARVVLPLPGGPHRMMLGRLPLRVSRRRTSTTPDWPTICSSFFGRSRVARGALGSDPAGSGKSSPWSVISQILNWERVGGREPRIRPHDHLLVLQLGGSRDLAILSELRPQPDGPNVQPAFWRGRPDDRDLEFQVRQRAGRPGGQSCRPLPPAALDPPDRARPRGAHPQGAGADPGRGI